MSHYYKPNGESCHEILGSSTGRLRPTTITDARKSGLLPSVTTILDILAKEQLVSWKMDQVALQLRRDLAAGMSFPEGDKEFCNIVKKRAMDQVGDAADLGTRIHTALEKMLQGEAYDTELNKYIATVPDVLAANRISITAHEEVLINPSVGYAGKTDAKFTRQHQPLIMGRGILDFKSRKSDTKYSEMTPWPGQSTQIAAYHMAAYGNIADADIGANCFISTTEPGRVELAWYSATELREEYEFFECLARAWQIRNKYVPAGVELQPVDYSE